MNNKIISISKRREQERKTKIRLFAILAIILIISATIFSTTIILADTEKNNTEYYKYFKSIEIEEGDTLWSIAEEYMTTEHYGSVNEYIKEIKDTNGLSSDTIKAGQNLIITYYSTEYK